jgi:hypothetical protein
LWQEAERQMRNLYGQVIRRKMAVDLRHFEFAVLEDLLKRQQVSTGHDEVTGEGVVPCQRGFCTMATPLLLL